MMTDDSPDLLRRFAANRSEEAFRALVRKHSGLVHATALRRLAGDQAAADDVTQEVFTLLARKAHRLGGVILSAWLALPAADRDAIILRFFEGRDYRGVGGSLGITEEAARKRIRRVLDR